MPTLHQDYRNSSHYSVELNDSAAEVFLNPGEYFVGGADFQVRTLLGSCVSITLWHPRHCIGAMSHYLLSSRCRKFSKQPRTRHERNGKYADEALELMVRELAKARVPIKECQAKIFGGGNMFPNHPIHSRFNVGLKNGETARELLADYEIPIVSENLFGIGHREIIFKIRNGDVWMRQSQSS